MRRISSPGTFSRFYESDEERENDAGGESDSSYHHSSGEDDDRELEETEREILSNLKRRRMSATGSAHGSDEDDSANFYGEPSDHDRSPEEQKIDDAIRFIEKSIELSPGHERASFMVPQRKWRKFHHQQEWNNAIRFLTARKFIERPGVRLAATCRPPYKNLGDIKRALLGLKSNYKAKAALKADLTSSVAAAAAAAAEDASLTATTRTPPRSPSRFDGTMKRPLTPNLLSERPQSPAHDALWTPPLRTASPTPPIKRARSPYEKKTLDAENRTKERSFREILDVEDTHDQMEKEASASGKTTAMPTKPEGAREETPTTQLQQKLKTQTNAKKEQQQQQLKQPQQKQQRGLRVPPGEPMTSLHEKKAAMAKGNKPRDVNIDHPQNCVFNFHQYYGAEV